MRSGGPCRNSRFSPVRRWRRWFAFLSRRIGTKYVLGFRKGRRSWTGVVPSPIHVPPRISQLRDDLRVLTPEVRPGSGFVLTAADDRPAWICGQYRSKQGSMRTCALPLWWASLNPESLVVVASHRRAAVVAVGSALRVPERTCAPLTPHTRGPAPLVWARQPMGGYRHPSRLIHGPIEPVRRFLFK